MESHWEMIRNEDASELTDDRKAKHVVSRWVVGSIELELQTTTKILAVHTTLQ